MMYLADPPPGSVTAGVLSLVIPLACLAIVLLWWYLIVRRGNTRL